MIPVDVLEGTKEILRGPPTPGTNEVLLVSRTHLCVCVSHGKDQGTEKDPTIGTPTDTDEKGSGTVGRWRVLCSKVEGLLARRRQGPRSPSMFTPLYPSKRSVQLGKTQWGGGRDTFGWVRFQTLTYSHSSHVGVLLSKGHVLKFNPYPLPPTLSYYASLRDRESLTGINEMTTNDNRAT